MQIIQIVKLLISAMLSVAPIKNNVTYKIGDPNSTKQLYYHVDPNDITSDKSDKFFIGADSSRFVIIEAPNSIIIGSTNATQQIYLKDPNSPYVKNGKININLKENEFTEIEMQYDVHLKDIAEYWMTIEQLPDINKDKIVNYVDFAIWISREE